MKNYIIIFLVSISLIGCEQKNKQPRIAVAGLAIESSTFSPARTSEEAFHVLTGKDVLDYKRIIRPMYPLDEDMEDPNLDAIMIPVYGDG